MANNSNHIMNRYGKWITNKQKERLRKLYKGYRQSTAGDMRSQYLNAHKGMYGVRTTASAYGLGEGYVARKKAQMDSSLAEAGRQYAAQADAAFENNAVRPAANATIQAENERKQREYEEKLRKAREKAAKQAKAQADFEKALEEYNRNKDKTDKENAKRLAEYKKAMAKYKKELKNAKQRGEKLDRLPQRQVLHGGQPLPKGLSLSADLHQYEGATSTPKPLKPLPKGKGKGKGKANGRGGLLSTDMYEYESGTGHQPTATSHQGLNNRPVAPKTNYAANQTAVQNRKKAKEAVVGKPTKPILAITDTPVPVPPHIEKDLVAKVEAMKPEEIPQLKADYINSAVEHENLVGDLYNALKPDMNRVSLAQEFDHWVGVAQNTTLSPAERKQAAMYASRAAEEYNLQDNGKAHKERVTTLMQMVNDSHDQLVQQQFLLQQLGVRMSEDEIGFDTNWLRSGNQLYGADNALVQQAQTFTTGKKEDTAELRQHLYAIDKHNRHRGWGLDSWEIPPEEAQWLEANGYGWINTTPELRSIEMSGDNAIPFSGNVEAYYQQINAKSHSYQRERNATTKLMAFSRMKESEQKNAIAAGEQKTGLAEILAGTSLEKAGMASLASLQGGRRAGSFADLASQIAKNLGLPKDYVTVATVEQLLQDEGSLAFIDYCYGIGDEQTAKDYLYNYTEVANRAQGEKIADLVSFNDAGKDAPKFEKAALEVIRTVVEFMAQFGYGATGNFAKGVKRIFTNEDVPVSVGEAFSRDVTTNKTERGWNPFWAQAVDSAAVSAGNNAASMLLGKGIGMVGSAIGGAVGGTIGTGIAKAASHAGSVLMGASAMGHAKQEALREGYGNKAATMYGILDGVSETILQEKVGGLVGLGDHGVFTKALGGLVNKIPSAMGRWGVNMVLDGLSEVGQELFGNVFENINRTVTLGEEHGLFDNFKDEAGQTVVSTLLSTWLLNSIGLGGAVRDSRMVSRIAKTANISKSDALMLMDVTRANMTGDKVDPKVLSKYNELTAVLTAAMPDNVVKAIDEGKMTVADWLTSEEGIVSGKLSGKLTEADTKTEAAKNPVTGAEIKAEDHTEALKGKTDEQKRDYLIAAAPTGKVGNAYYTTTNGKAIDFKNLDTTQKANYVLAQKCAKAFEGSVDVVIHDTLPLSNGAMVGKDGKLHIALDVTNAQGRESIAYWTLAHEAGHALKIADGEAWNEMFNVLTDYAKNHKDRDGKNLYDALVDSITNQYKYDNNSDAFNDEMFSLIAERMVGSEGEQWAATLGDNTIFDAIAKDKNASAKAKRGFLGKMKNAVEKLSRQFRDGGFSKERKRLAKIREQLTEAYKRINEVPSIRDAAQARKEAEATAADYQRTAGEIEARNVADRLLMTEEERKASRPDIDRNDVVFSEDSTRHSLRATDTPAFKEWFGKSKIVDEDGNPLIVYHGTDEDFDTFDETKGRSTMDIQGMFFSPWEIDASGYGKNVKSFYLSIQNPAPEGVAYRVLNKYKGQNEAGKKARQELIRLGYDGVNNGNEEYIAFYPNQIKSATNNVGTFDKNNPNTRYQNRATDTKYLSLAEKYRDGTASDEDIDVLNKAVEEAARKAGYDSPKLYHGTTAFGWVKPKLQRGEDSRGGNVGLWTAADKKSVEYYAGESRNVREIGFGNTEEEIADTEFWNNVGKQAGVKNEHPEWMVADGIYQLYGNTTNFLDVKPENKGADYSNILYNGERFDTVSLAEYAKKQGYAGLHIDGVLDGNVSSDEYIFFNPGTQIKSADPVTYDDNGDIIPLSERFNAENEDIRYSMRKTDAEYMKAVEDGDEATQERIIEEAAKEAGYTYRGWHGTANNFTVFDKRRAGQNWGGDSRLGPGFYFAHDQNTASKWTDGTRVVDAFLSMQKPLDLRKEVPDDISRAIDKKFDDRMGKYESWYPVSKEQFRENIERLRENEKRNPAEFLDSFKYDSEGKMTDGIHEMLSDLGYDGIISDDEIVVFSPSQIKSADLITRDDDGNIIPPSKRFDINDEDIRYQQRDFRIDFNVPQLDTKALHEAVKGGEGTVENRFEVKYEKTDAGFAVHITDKDSGKTYDRAETVTEGNAKAEAERAAAAVIRNIKRNEKRREFREYADKREADARLAERMHEGAIRARIERKAGETEQAYKERIKKIYEDRYRREIKNTALKWNKKLVDMLARPTENKHVPVQLARSVAEFCEEVTKYLDGTTKRGEKILDKIRKAYDRAFTDEQTILRAKSEDAGYDARGAVLNTSQKDEQLAEMLKELSDITAEKSFAELTRDEMDALLNVVRGVAHTVTDANKLIGEAEGKTVWQTGSTMIEQLENAPKVSTKLRGYLATSLDLRRLARIFSGSNEDAEFVKLVEQLNQGAIEKERVAQELQAIFKPVTDEYGNEIKKWYGKKAEWLDTGIVTKDGVPVKITKGMRVSLALHVLNEGNMRHIERGGLTIPDAKLYAQGKLADAYANSKPVRLTAEQINGIIANMTEAEKAYVEAAKQLFHDRAGFYVNKTSLQLAGYTKANVENYFPIHTDENFNMTDFASMLMNGSIEGQGFLQERKNASNPIYLEDITSVVNRQIRGVALYAGMAIPVRNFNAVMNAAAYEDENGNWVPRTTVKQTLAKTMGVYGAKVVEGFVEDASEMSQRVDVTPVERIAGKLATNYVKAVLLGNLKVAMKQVASYPTAAAVIPWKYLAKGLASANKNMMFYAPLGFGKARKTYLEKIGREFPLFKVRQAGNANEIASITNKPGMEQKLPALLGWITTMDVETVRNIGLAAEYMVQDQHPDYAIGSEAYKQAVAQIFNQTVQQTQPNFTPLQRSAALRSKNPIVRSLTLFGTQRMQNGGILIEAAYELKQAKGKSAEEIAAARRKLGRAVASQVVQNFLLLAATFAVDALRGRMKQWQDDDDELTPESIASKMGDTFLSNFLGSFLGGTELYETVSNMYKKANGQTTYDTEFSVPALDAIETIMSFGQSGIPNFVNYITGDHTDEEKMNKLKSFSMELAKVAGYATGLPLENAVKDVFKGFVPAYKDIRDWKKTGELIPYLWQSGKLDSKKTRERYEAWIDSGHKGRAFFAIDKLLKGVGKRDDRAEILREQANLSPEDMALLMEMYDTSNGYAEGTGFYDKNGKLKYDFGETPAEDAAPAPVDAEPEAPADLPATSTEDATAPAAVPAPTAAPAEQTTAPASTAQPKSDKYTKAAEKWAQYGVTQTQAKSAVEKWDTLKGSYEGSRAVSEYRTWLTKQNLTGRQRFAMFSQANADLEKKATEFNKKYGTKYEALWNAYTKYNGESFHGEEYRSWVEKQTSDYYQRFALVEFAEPRSNWIEHAEELHKAGVSYKAVWEAARYAKNQNGRGKKDRIIAYAKKLGMTSKQAENIYKWFG